mmetsp:Transcript_10174/g.44262  ORF Transcript_10174/g.44262 Transcript_10174/m.44262 type:complete len:216 (-) Transcript_10174:101-748(-)
MTADRFDSRRRRRRDIRLPGRYLKRSTRPFGAATARRPCRSCWRRPRAPGIRTRSGRSRRRRWRVGADAAATTTTKKGGRGMTGPGTTRLWARGATTTTTTTRGTRSSRGSSGLDGGNVGSIARTTTTTTTKLTSRFPPSWRRGLSTSWSPRTPRTNRPNSIPSVDPPSRPSTRCAPRWRRRFGDRATRTSRRSRAATSSTTAATPARWSARRRT